MLAPTVHQPASPSTRPLRLLVVEDDADLRKHFSMVVEGWSFPVELSTAQDGFQALVRIGQWMPDMVITDLNMPGMNGFEMVRSLRQGGPSFADLQVGAVTALSMGDVADRGGLPEGTVVFQKPVDSGAIEALARTRQQHLRID
ncbi:response regulator [Rhodoferax sp.]|uniref:response regulator n=1 Tax=Rhodoferax sp. TaxID=50421 RepID=UPI0025DC0447|nr:response regulator [Rhodoferax sp.]